VREADLAQLATVHSKDGCSLLTPGAIGARHVRRRGSKNPIRDGGLSG
jgi:hypothetical protein